MQRMDWSVIKKENCSRVLNTINFSTLLRIFCYYPTWYFIVLRFSSVKIINFSFHPRLRHYTLYFSLVFRNQKLHYGSNQTTLVLVLQ